MKAWLAILIAATVLAGNCTLPDKQNKNAAEMEEGEVCAVNVSGMAFTRSLNDAKAAASVEDNKLVLTSPAKSDYFNEPDGTVTIGNAPVLLSKVDNTQPFTFQVKVTPTFTATYDAGAVYIYQHRKWWFKFAFEQDERRKTRIVTVRTTDTSDDNNHDVVDSTRVFLKISSDTKTIGFYYSSDKENWQLVRVFKNDFPKELWLGLSAQSPTGSGNRAAFEEVTFTKVSIKDFRMGL